VCGNKRRGGVGFRKEDEEGRKMKKEEEGKSLI